jgi:hypothetical protein
MAMRIAIATMILCLAASIAFAGEPAGKITFNGAGFSIAPLDESQKGPGAVLIMFMPATEGFAPNVNVLIQSYTDGIDAYAKLTRAQFKEAGWKLLSEPTIDGDAMTFEYTGLFNGQALHWYSRAVQKVGIIYLVTATASKDQWPNVADKLKACVNSFEPI